MITHASDIELDPRVQIVMHMDGWGPPWMKFESYRDYIDLEPVEFTEFKLFSTTAPRRATRCSDPPSCSASGRSRCTSSIGRGSGQVVRASRSVARPRLFPACCGCYLRRPVIGIPA
jgi:hypothetical protein